MIRMIANNLFLPFSAFPIHSYARVVLMRYASQSTSRSAWLPQARALWFLPVFALGCDACGCGSSLAKLEEKHGDVTRDYDASRLQWLTAPKGATFKVGDAVRTTAGATAQLSVRGGSEIKLVENTIVRFLSERPDEAGGQLALELGEAAVTAGSDGLLLRGGFGIARIAPGSAIRVSADEVKAALEMLVGSAQIERQGFDTVSLEVGDPELVLDLSLGTAVIDDGTDPSPDAGAPRDASVDSGDADAGTDGGESETSSIPIETRGVIQQRGEDGTWTRLPRSASELTAGTRVRLRPRARMTLRRGEDTVTVLGPAELELTGSEERFVTLSTGRAQANATAAPLGIGVPGGTVVGRPGGPGSASEIGLRRGSAEVQLNRGSAELRGSTGERYVLRSGQRATLTSAGKIDAENRAPARAHLALPAGASASIHDPSTPVAVQLRFPSACPGEGVIEVGRGLAGLRSFGTGSANIALRPGRHRYTLKCSENGTPKGSAVASGTLTVLRDSGRSRLPIRPPRNVVDTDGRRYTLLYQNLLPVVTVRWPQAPGSGPYSLVLQRSRGAAKRFEAGSASITLESGDVPEGVHRLYFEGDGQRSPTTTITVGYDNAASAVFLREPGLEPISGGSVQVSGVALDGWTVNVGGNALPLDNQFRFAGTAPVPSDVDAVSIRLTHARHGVHYYLRRIAR